ncbi:MAG: hypothetical protein OXD00_08680 [Gammaproteobacteria bacterium]|nr:hypothetical protein [Gammaproteobacteria bacterium]
MMKAFEHSRESGRDFHKHPWKKIPIKRFDADNREHAELATLTELAEEMLANWFDRSENAHLKLGQVGWSARIRDFLTQQGVLPEIDLICRKLFPRQAV